MRILVVTNLFPNPWQPQRATFNRQQFAAMAQNHEVRVICPLSWTDERGWRRQGGAKLPPTRRTQLDGIAVDHPRYYYTPRVLRRWYGVFFRESIRAAFSAALAEFRPEIVLGSWAYPDGWAAVCLAGTAGLPVVLKVHGSDVLTIGKHPARRTGTADALRSADAVIAVSRHLADEVIAIGIHSERVRLIYNGVDTGLFAPGSREAARNRLGLDPQTPTLLYVGNLVPVKGPDLLVDACGILAASGQRFCCHVIGQGDMREALAARAAALGIDSQFRLVGAVEHGNLPDWFRAADLMVLPSRSEGVPNVLLEASACGLPYVASRVGGVPEIAHLGRSTLVSPNDATALAEGIRAALAASLSDTAPRSRAAGLRSHEESAREVIDVLRCAVERRRGQPAPAATAL